MSKYEKLEPVFAELDSGDEHIHPMFNTVYDTEDETPRRKTPFLVIGSLLVLAFTGGGLVFAYKQGLREGNRTAPPVITASSKPIKTIPKKPGGIRIPNQNKRVYDRLDKKPVKVTERLMPTAEEIMDLPKKPVIKTMSMNDAGFSGKRILIPPENSKMSNPAVEPAAKTGSVKVSELLVVNTPPDIKSSGKTTPLPTHEVDVFTITPDGVFPNMPSVTAVEPARVVEKKVVRSLEVETPAVPEPVSAKPDPIKAAAPQPILPKRITRPPIEIGDFPELVDGKTLTERLLEAENRLTKSRVDERASVKTEVVSKIVEAVPVKSTSILSPGVGTAKPSMNAPDNTMRVASLPPLPRRKPMGSTSSKPMPTALRRPASVSKTVAMPAAAGTGRFVVQVASHRRQVDALAEFAGLKRRHPNVIGNYKPSIQRANLGDRGIYYRLRIGPLASKAEAASFCESLKTAGKNDCLIRRR